MMRFETFLDAMLVELDAGKVAAFAGPEIADALFESGRSGTCYYDYALNATPASPAATKVLIGTCCIVGAGIKHAGIKINLRQNTLTAEMLVEQRVIAFDDLSADIAAKLLTALQMIHDSAMRGEEISVLDRCHLGLRGEVIKAACYGEFKNGPITEGVLRKGIFAARMLAREHRKPSDLRYAA